MVLDDVDAWLEASSMQRANFSITVFCTWTRFPTTDFRIRRLNFHKRTKSRSWSYFMMTFNHKFITSKSTSRHQKWNV